MTTARAASGHAKRPLLGLRARPGRLALSFMHLPLRAYAHDKGHLLGRTFLQVTHVGRSSGRTYRSVAMVLGDDPVSGEVAICSAWDSDWFRNLQAHPATSVTIGRDSFTPVQRLLDEDEAVQVVQGFRAAHPHRARLLSHVLGWGDIEDEEAVRALVRAHPFLAFRPDGP